MQIFSVNNWKIHSAKAKRRSHDTWVYGIQHTKEQKEVPGSWYMELIKVTSMQQYYTDCPDESRGTESLADYPSIRLSQEEFCSSLREFGWRISDKHKENWPTDRYIEN